MYTDWPEFVVMMTSNNDYAEFRAESVKDAIKQCERKFDGFGWRLYAIEPDGKVGTNCLATGSASRASVA